MYRGISLSHSINKVFDYVIIELYRENLMSYDLQFAYKTQHSTALCSVVHLETLQYYRQNGSQVFSCLLDASKAFDRIHYGNLFNMLFYRSLSQNCKYINIHFDLRQQVIIIVILYIQWHTL